MSALPIHPKQNSDRVWLFTTEKGTWAGFRPSWDRLVLPYCRGWIIPKVYMTNGCVTEIRFSTRGTIVSRFRYRHSLNNDCAKASRAGVLLDASKQETTPETQPTKCCVYSLERNRDSIYYLLSNKREIISIGSTVLNSI